MILDGAEVIAISKKDNFGVIKYTANSIKPIPVEYLAISKYENDKAIYLFLCNDNMEVEQDSIFDSIEDAKKCAAEINKNVIWESGIIYINFSDVDYQGGRVNLTERFGEDMLEVFYLSGYTIDVGYIECINSFVITVVKNNDWTNIIKEIKAKSDLELKRKLKETIKWTVAQEK